MHGENLRKFTETRARPPRARYALIFAAAKNTVPTASVRHTIQEHTCTPVARKSGRIAAVQKFRRIMSLVESTT